MGTLKNLTGQTFGRLTVISQGPSNRHKKATWNCRCICGEHITVVGNNLRSGNSQSCGCLHNELLSKQATTHGLTEHSDFKVWSGMIQRCTNSEYFQYYLYGGRGITVCSQWLNSPAQFFTDMGPRPSRNHSIDRENNDGNYTPENCRWATDLEQSNNTRRNRLLAFENEILTVAQWARKLDLPYSIIIGRLHRNWSVERTLTEPVKLSTVPMVKPPGTL